MGLNVRVSTCRLFVFSRCCFKGPPQPHPIEAHWLPSFSRLTFMVSPYETWHLGARARFTLVPFRLLLFVCHSHVRVRAHSVRTCLLKERDTGVGTHRNEIYYRTGKCSDSNNSSNRGRSCTQDPANMAIVVSTLVSHLSRREVAYPSSSESLVTSLVASRSPTFVERYSSRLVWM